MNSGHLAGIVLHVSSTNVIPLRSGRARGLLIGFLIGGTVALLEALVSSGDEPGIRVGIGAILTGATGGWLFAPSAIRAKSRWRLALVVLGFAAFVTVMGAVVVALQVEFRHLPAQFSIELAAQRAGSSLTVAEFGILIVGPLMAPLTLGAAAMWSAILRDGTRDISADAPESHVISPNAEPRSVSLGQRITNGLALAGAVLAFAFGAYLLIVGPENVVLTPDGASATSRSATLAGLIPLGIGITAVWAVTRRRTSGFWLAAGLAISAAVIFVFSFSLQLGAIAALLALAATVSTATTRDIRER